MKDLWFFVREIARTAWNRVVRGEGNNISFLNAIMRGVINEEVSAETAVHFVDGAIQEWSWLSLEDRTKWAEVHGLLLRMIALGEDLDRADRALAELSKR